MPPEFNIVVVPDDVLRVQEPMGTKDKFWYLDLDLGTCLFKEGHENTGEDWCECVSAELCQLLNLPCAAYELAIWQGRRGVVSPNFMSNNESLFPGNEVLYRLDRDYPAEQRFRVQKHNIESIYGCFHPLEVRLPVEPVPAGIVTAKQVFLGYLMLDAWIGNTDRHHQNWALVQQSEEKRVTYRLAPTHDHAASLGCTLTENEVELRLTTKDRGRSVRGYAESPKARSAIFLSENDKNPLGLLEVFRLASLINPDASQIWLGMLENVTLNQIEMIFHRIPSHIASEAAKRFAIDLLVINRERLLALK